MASNTTLSSGVGVAVAANHAPPANNGANHVTVRHQPVGATTVAITPTAPAPPLVDHPLTQPSTDRNPFSFGLAALANFSTTYTEFVRMPPQHSPFAKLDGGLICVHSEHLSFSFQRDTVPSCVHCNSSLLHNRVMCHIDLDFIRPQSDPMWPPHRMLIPPDYSAISICCYSFPSVTRACVRLNLCSMGRRVSR